MGVRTIPIKAGASLMIMFDGMVFDTGLLLFYSYYYCIVMYLAASESAAGVTSTG